MKDLMRRQVSRDLQKLSELEPVSRPPAGWIRTIREALGMTTQQMAKRLGVIQQRISALEKAEAHGGLKLQTLHDAAAALNCRLVYFLVPEEPIETMLEKRARIIAEKRIARSAHSMDLEAQPVSEEERQQLIADLIN